jgi:hypothetical protein
MNDVQKLSLTVLQTVAEFLALLPADQLNDLADGSARLTIIPKGTAEPLQLTANRPAATKRAVSKAPAPPSLEILALQERLDAMQTREGAEALLSTQTASSLKDLAASLGMGKTGTKKEHIARLVEFTIGNRLNSQAIRQL